MPNSSTTSRGRSRNLGLSGIFTRSHKRKMNPSGNSLGSSSEAELHRQRQRRSRHGNLPKRGQGSRPSQEDVKEATEDGEGTLRHGRSVRKPRRTLERNHRTKLKELGR